MRRNQSQLMRKPATQTTMIGTAYLRTIPVFREPMPEIIRKDEAEEQCGTEGRYFESDDWKQGLGKSVTQEGGEQHESQMEHHRIRADG